MKIHEVGAEKTVTYRLVKQLTNENSHMVSKGFSFLCFYFLVGCNFLWLCASFSKKYSPLSRERERQRQRQRETERDRERDIFSSVYLSLCMSVCMGERNTYIYTQRHVEPVKVYRYMKVRLYMHI